MCVVCFFFACLCEGGWGLNEYTFFKVQYARSTYPFYIVTYYMKWVTTFWTHSSKNNRQSNFLGTFFCMVKYSKISEFTWMS